MRLVRKHGSVCLVVTYESNADPALGWEGADRLVLCVRHGDSRRGRRVGQLRRIFQDAGYPRLAYAGLGSCNIISFIKRLFSFSRWVLVVISELFENRAILPRDFDSINMLICKFIMDTRCCAFAALGAITCCTDVGHRAIVSPSSCQPTP